MSLVLIGDIGTSFLTKKRHFHLKGCRWEITQGQWQPYIKINAAVPMYPFAYSSYTGTITVRYKCKSWEVAQKKLQELKIIRRIGRGSSEGLGRIYWREAWFEEATSLLPHKRYGKIKIRKGLPYPLPSAVQDLILYGLLHDFFDTKGVNGHKSKIYIEPELNNQTLVDLLRQSHSDSEHVLVMTFKKYDRIAAFLTRKRKAPRLTRYNYQARGEFQAIDFEQLANQIAQVVNTRNVYKLYLFIHRSRELDQLNEAFEFGHTSLKFHLLIIANMIVRDYLHGYLEAFLGNYIGQFSHRSEKNTVAS
ncbi:MAG: hypothetical protein ACE5OZ_07070 [Candidatus Heimdallarchaeota archaeon]